MKVGKVERRASGGVRWRGRFFPHLTRRYQERDLFLETLIFSIARVYDGMGGHRGSASGRNTRLVQGSGANFYEHFINDHRDAQLYKAA